LICDSDTYKRGTGMSFTLTSTPPKLVGSGTVATAMGSRVVNETPNKLAQLPGLQNSVDWRSAEFRAVRIAAFALRTSICIAWVEDEPALFVAVTVSV
jgi:hypothetical protein